MNATQELNTNDGKSYVFHHVVLRFGGMTLNNVFAQKNNKSLRETLSHHRYLGLARDMGDFSEFMNFPLGKFLLSLKLKGNPLYKRFLNKHGDKSYSVFSIDDRAVVEKKGVYAFYVGDKLCYVGRCRDTMKQRINQGYGKIHPKNCYIDGQSTNCHLNARITEAGDSVSLWFCSLVFEEEIKTTETQLIRIYQPAWNMRP